MEISPDLLHRWKEKHEARLDGKKLAESEREDPIRLRKENRSLSMEKAILKKVSAYYDSSKRPGKVFGAQEFTL